MEERPKKRRGPLLWLAGRTWRFWTVAAIPFLYVLSFGPSCWWLSEPVTLDFVGIKARKTPDIYAPMGRVCRWLGSGRISGTINWYATLFVPAGEGIACGILDRGDSGIVFMAR